MKIRTFWWISARAKREEIELDQIEKALFILPAIPLLDIVAVFFSLSLGGQQVGIAAGPIYERYHELGLVAWSSFLFIIFLACVWRLRHWKRRFAQEPASKTNRIVLLVGINIAFLVEALWMGVIIQNLLAPFLPPLTTYAIWAVVIFTCFVLLSLFARNEMKQIIRV